MVYFRSCKGVDGIKNNVVKEGQWVIGVSWCIKHGFCFKVSGTTYLTPKKTNCSWPPVPGGNPAPVVPGGPANSVPDSLAGDDYAVGQSV